MMDTVVNRLVRYAKVYSESDYYGQSGTPSAQREFDMAHLVVEELHALGIDNAFADEKCYVYGWLPATPGYEHLPAIGLIAHMDTSPDMTGKDVKPQILHYEGGDIVLNRELNIVMEAKQFPELAKYVGQDLVCTDGTTLLGADDKAGIAIILQAVEELLAQQTPHGKICLGFTPDEEIGRGASNFDVAGFGADFAYTVDGGEITDYEYETFNAAMAEVIVHGFSIHPGSAKDKMKNALLMAMEFNALLPALETPGHTEGYEGFFHLQEMEGKVEQARMVYIIRDHSMERFQQRKAAFEKAVAEMNRRYGTGTVEAKVEDQYYNMYERLKDHPEILALAEAAMRAGGIDSPTHSPIRGGTDGSVLTFKGLLCPNLPTGGHNAHGRFEYVPVQSLEIGVKTIKALVGAELVEEIMIGKESTHHV
ncbi:peptidase T [Lawsonibacter sp. LCP25S3_G6]|uniref:peptidase T n=1 Tax=unclassified Lawsonibacter TaxID=2617946 RepID=UPI003F9BBD0A